MSLAVISDWLRSDILIPSAGWLADIVPLISDALGVWDAFVTAGIFIMSWVVIRVSDSLTSLILGLTFDLTIPLQHFFNENVKGEHQAHLDNYWPVFTFATGVEVLCFFLVHPDLFTLVVCLKTTIMTAIWLGRRKDGSFLTTALGSRSQGGPGDGRRSEGGGGSENESPNAKLEAVGYDDAYARKGMIDHLESLQESKKQEQWVEWLADIDPESQKKSMDKYRKQEWDRQLKEAGYDRPPARRRLVRFLADRWEQKRPDIVETKLRDWPNSTQEEKEKRMNKILE